MVGTKITITDTLARAVTELLDHLDRSDLAVTIAYDDDFAEQEWLVKFDAGWGTSTYIVNDQTGEYHVAGLGVGSNL